MKFLKYIFVTFYIALGLLVCAVVGLAAWAYTGPRDLSQYLPQIQQSLNTTAAPNKIYVNNAQLVFGGVLEPVYIEVKDVTISNKDSAVLAKLKNMQLGYNILRLITGNFIPSTIKLKNAEFDAKTFLTKNDDSTFNIKDFGDVDSLEIEDSHLIMPTLGEIWQLDKVKVSLGDVLKFSGQIHPTTSEKIIVKAMADIESGDYEINADVTNLSTARFGLLEESVKGLDVKATGKLFIEVDGKKLQSISANLPALSGVIDRPDLLRTKLEIASAKLDAEFHFADKKANIKNADILMQDGTKLRANGYYKSAKNANLNANVNNLKIENLHKYWPKDIGNNAVDWINLRLKNGLINNSVIKVDDEDVNINFDVAGMNVYYVDGLLPVINATGKGHMNATTLTLNVNSGKVGKSAISNTKVVISEMGGVMEKLLVDGQIAGNVQDLADFYVKINKKRGKELLFDSASSVNGQAKTKMTLKLPLSASLKIADVNLQLDSNITGASVTAPKLSANSSNVALKINDLGYELKGYGLITLNDKKTISMQNTPVNFAYKNYSKQFAIDVSANITASEIGIGQLGATKPKGEAGTLDVKVAGQNINKLSISSKSLNLDASGKLTADLSDIQSLDVRNFEGGGAKFAAQITNNNGYDISITADSLNIVPLLESMSSSATDESGASSEKPMRITGKMGKVIFYNRQEVKDVTANITCTKRCDYFEFISKDLNISQTPTKLDITSADAAKVLRMLDVYNDMEGGALNIKAKGDGNGGYEGVATITDFKVTKAKTLAKILTLGSLTGIADTLQGKGIAFKKLRTKFKRTDEQLKIEDFRMAGAAIGLTADGTLNRKSGKVDFGGKIIPAYTANTLLGKIPIFGDIIIGDEGVFAFAYDVKGNVEDPEVFVNPLSVLAPGFLQEIFQ